MGTIFTLFLISKRTDDITKRKKAFVYVYSWWKTNQTSITAQRSKKLFYYWTYDKMQQKNTNLL